MKVTLLPTVALSSPWLVDSRRPRGGLGRHACLLGEYTFLPPSLQLLDKTFRYLQRKKKIQKNLSLDTNKLEHILWTFIKLWRELCTMVFCMSTAVWHSQCYSVYLHWGSFFLRRNKIWKGAIIFCLCHRKHDTPAMAKYYFMIDRTLGATYPVLLRKLWLVLQLLVAPFGLNQKAGEHFPSVWRSQP